MWLLPELFAQPSLPNLLCYEKEDYRAGRQNWDIEIDSRGIVFFGNSDGLLFNVYGEWGLEKLPGGGAIRSLHISGDTIWCGGEEYGYFLKTDAGYSYHSLGVLDGGLIWNIENSGGEIYFQSENQLIVFDRVSGAMEEYIFPEGIWSSTIWKNQLWMVLRDGQIGYFSTGEFEQQISSELFLNQEVRRLFIHQGQLHLLMFRGGIYRFDGQQIRSVKLQEPIRGKTLFTALSYDQETYLLGTVSDGFMQLGGEGELLEWVNSGHGLIDNTVLSMKPDVLGNIWLGLDYGIARIELQSAINNIFDGGATYAIKDIRGTTYLATNKGLFSSTSGAPFEFVQNTGGQVWMIRQVGEKILVCHNRGLLQLKAGEVIPLVDFSGFLDVAHFEGTDYYLGSTYHGLILIHDDGSHFYFVENLNLWGNTRLIYDRDHQCVWAETDPKRIVQISLTEEEKVEIREETLITKVFETASGIFFSDDENLLQYREGTFVKADHPLIGSVKGAGLKALDVSRDGNYITYIQSGQIWLEELLPDGNLHSYHNLLQSLNRKFITDNEYIDLQGDLLRVATDRGVTTFNMAHSTPFKKSSLPVVSSLTVLNENNLKYFYPYPEDGMNFSSGNKDLLFRFSVIKSMHDMVEFRHRLESRDREWSEWSSLESELMVPQLKGGSYVFHLQSRINGGPVEDFTLGLDIERLWYQTAWVSIPIALFFLAWMFVIIYFMSRRSRRKLESQKQHYRRQDARKTLEMKNEQLLQYIEIISHKNEFLNRVREGLEQMRNAEAQRWVNLISDEVNNEKKEFLFHKLFSEVHQDFIARLNVSFPELTSNDVRMLSFIRVNLDKREICNLMNISQRSLDTNRYRLRKKLGLSHKTDLDQFVRDF